MKHLSTLLLSILCGMSLIAQKLDHGIGTVLSISQYKKDVNPFLCILYAPHLTIHEKGNFSVALSIPATAGALLEMPFGEFMSDGESSNGTRWFISFPLIANLNWGAGSTKNNLEKLGYFFGGGMGYFYDAGSMYYKDDKIIKGMAATLQTGLRIGMGKRKRNNIEIKLNCSLPIQQTNVPHFGLGGIFNW